MPINTIRGMTAAIAMAAAACIAPGAASAQQRPAAATAPAVGPEAIARTYASTAWTPAVFRAAAGRELEAVQSVYRDYISQNPGLSVETALIDVQGKGVASLAVRFSKGGCRADAPGGCRIAILYMRPGGWEQVMTASGVNIEVERPGQAPARGGQHALLRMDGREVYEASPGGYYSATAWGSGTPMTSRVNPRALPAGLNGAPKDWFAEEVESPRGTLSVYRAALCYESQGCEIAVYLQTPPTAPGQPPVVRRMVSTFAVGDRIALRRVPRQGMPDILVDGPTSLRTWVWAAQSAAYSEVTDGSAPAGGGR